MDINKKVFDVKKHLGKISRDKTNPFYRSKYMDINKLLENLEPLFQERDLLLTQPIIENNVYSKIMDIDSGEYIDSYIKLPELDDPQKIGSCITYYRRYTLKSLLGIQEEDDDGNYASLNNKDIIWLTEDQFNKALNSDLKGISATLEKYDSNTHKMKKQYREKLEQKLNEII